MNKRHTTTHRMTDAEFQALMRGADPAFRRFLLFLQSTGCRPHEARHIRWRHVQLDRQAIVLSEITVAGRPRVIALVPAMVKLLTSMRRERPASEDVFIFLDFHNPGMVARAFRRARQRAGLPGNVSLYSIRRGFIARVIGRGLEQGLTGAL